MLEIRISVCSPLEMKAYGNWISHTVSELKRRSYRRRGMRLKLQQKRENPMIDVSDMMTGNGEI
jgi:hypothetical protein